MRIIQMLYEKFDKGVKVSLSLILLKLYSLIDRNVAEIKTVYSRKNCLSIIGLGDAVTNRSVTLQNRQSSKLAHFVK